MKFLCFFIVLIFTVVTIADANGFRRRGLWNPSKRYRPYEIMDLLRMSNVTVLNNRPNASKIIARDAKYEMEDGSLYIFDLSDVIQKYKNWLRFMPRVIPFYAIKSNDSPYILKVLASMGTGFDCASKGELKKVLRLGVPPSRIIFASPAKQKPALIYARKNGVKKMTFDSEYELYKIAKGFPRADLLIRIRVDAKEAIRSFGEMFGCEPDTEALDLIKLAKKLGLKVVGVAFHIGSGAKEFQVFDKAISAARRLFDFGASEGYKFRIVDLGGGFPGEIGSSLKEASLVINKALNDYFPNDNITVMAEPGRYFSASSCTTVCRITSKRKVVRDGKVKKIMYYINDSLYGSFSQIFTENRVFEPIPVEKYKLPLFNCTIWGQSLDSFDKLAEVFLPELRIGDFIKFNNMGAYTLPAISHFNSAPHPTFHFYIAKNDIYALNPDNIEKCLRI